MNVVNEYSEKQNGFAEVVALCHVTCRFFDRFLLQGVDKNWRQACFFYLAPGLINEVYWQVNSRRSIIRIADPILGLCDHYSELFTRMEALNFKMLWLSRYYSYRLVYYRPSTSYRVEPTYEGSVKLAQPFLKNQPVREFWRSFP